MHASDNYVSIFTLYELTAMNNIITNTAIHTFHIIGKCPWINMSITLYIYVPLQYYCYLHVGPTGLHIQVKKQQTATSNYHTLKCQIYATYAHYFMCTYQMAMSVYRPYMNSLQ